MIVVLLSSLSGFVFSCSLFLVLVGGGGGGGGGGGVCVISYDRSPMRVR